jgi:hypothetical protein
VARGEGILSPETNAGKKLARYSTISAVYLKYALKKKGWCPLLTDSVHFFLTFSCNYVNIIVEIYGYKADNENSLCSNVGFYILAQHLQICETRKPHLAL